MIDSHCHLDDKKFNDDLVDVIKRAEEQGIKHIICPSTDTESFQFIAAIQDKFPGYISTAIGIHPSEAKKTAMDDLDKFPDLIRQFKPVAIGEIGLDYYWTPDNKSEQQKLFRVQLKMAEIYQMPVIIHSRNSVKDCISIINDYAVQAVFHCYSEDLKNAEKIIEMGHSLSFTGNITYPKSEQLRDIIKSIPVSAFFLETDAPYLSPQIKRGRRNEPAYVKYLYKFISELKSIPLKELIPQLEKNITHLFNIQILS